MSIVFGLVRDICGVALSGQRARAMVPKVLEYNSGIDEAYV